MPELLFETTSRLLRTPRTLRTLIQGVLGVLRALRVLKVLRRLLSDYEERGVIMLPFSTTSEDNASGIACVWILLIQ